MQPDELARTVVLMVRTSMAPVFERLAAAEARLAALDGVRDRVVAIETRQAVPAPAPVVDVPDPLSLSTLSNLSKDICLLAERVSGVETKVQKEPEPKTLEDPRVHELNTRLASTESAVSLALSKEIELRDRLQAVEARAAVPGPVGPAGKDGVDGRNGVDGKDGLNGKDGSDAAVGDIKKDFDALRERLQVVEVRGVVPGPAGPAGKDGAPGRDGRDGKDGVELKDLSMTQEHDRAFTLRARMGGEMKEFGTFTVPVHIYRGVWVEGKTYERGDGVTWGGSHWHCNSETTDKPGDGSKDWTLTVKRGRDGKDGKDAEGPLPVVKR